MRSFFAILAVLLWAAAAGAAEPQRDAPAAPDDARLVFLKGLEGSWVGESPSGNLPEGRFEFRITAGGSVVEEREMVGTPMEMVTLYHMDGDRLVATHYCMLGNQPHLTAAARVVDDTLTFACDGKPGNTRSHDEEHVHAWSMRLGGDGRLYYTAELVQDGQVTETPSVVLTRQTDNARR